MEITLQTGDVSTYVSNVGCTVHVTRELWSWEEIEIWNRKSIWWTWADFLWFRIFCPSYVLPGNLSIWQRGRDFAPTVEATRGYTEAETRYPTNAALFIDALWPEGAIFVLFDTPRSDAMPALGDASPEKSLWASCWGVFGTRGQGSDLIGSFPTPTWLCPTACLENDEPRSSSRNLIEFLAIIKVALSRRR